MNDQLLFVLKDEGCSPLSTWYLRHGSDIPTKYEV